MPETRNTPQRKIILSILRQMEQHPTAEQVYAMVHQQHPRISRATVYRNLNFLAERKIINRVPVPDGADTFDLRTESHYHIQCEKCGKLFDISLPFMHHLEDKIIDKKGFLLHSHHILFQGICPDCQK